MAPIDAGAFVVIGMAGKTPERLVEAVPSEATHAYIVRRDENDTCASEAEAARRALATRDTPIEVEVVPCNIYNPISCFALVDKILRQHAGARLRVVVGTGTNVFALAAYQAAGGHGAEVVNVTEDRGEQRVRMDSLQIIPKEPDDDTLVALNIIASQRDGRITGKKLQTLLKRHGRPQPGPDDNDLDVPRKSNRSTEEQRRGVRAQRFIVDRLERNGLIDTPPSRDGIPYRYLDRTYVLSDAAKAIVAAYGHRFPPETWAAAPVAEPSQAGEAPRRRGRASA